MLLMISRLLIKKKKNQVIQNIIFFFDRSKYKLGNYHHKFQRTVNVLLPFIVRHTLVKISSVLDTSIPSIILCKKE